MHIYKFKFVGGPFDGKAYSSQKEVPEPYVYVPVRVPNPGSFCSHSYERFLYRRIRIICDGNSFYFYAPDGLDDSQCVQLLVKP